MATLRTPFSTSHWAISRRSAVKRQRGALVAEAAGTIQRMQKVLTEMNVQRSLALVGRSVVVSAADLTPLESLFTNRNRAESTIPD
jgi:hypothetical protein